MRLQAAAAELEAAGHAVSRAQQRAAAAEEAAAEGHHSEPSGIEYQVHRLTQLRHEWDGV